jgi:hypothetical protein
MNENLININRLPEFIPIPIAKIVIEDSSFEQYHEETRKSLKEFQEKMYDHCLEDKHFFIQKIIINSEILINIYKLNMEFLFSHKFCFSGHWINLII